MKLVTKILLAATLAFQTVQASTLDTFLYRGSIDLHNVQDVDKFHKIYKVKGYIDLSRSKLDNINGLENIMVVNSFINLKGNNLRDLDGLKSLRYVGRDLFVDYNKLDNIDGLQNMTFIDGILNLAHNNLVNVDGLKNMKIIGRDLVLSFNDLRDLNGLKNLEELGGTLNLIGNPNLEDLSALNNLQVHANEKLFFDNREYKVKLAYNSKICKNLRDLDWTDSKGNLRKFYRTNTKVSNFCETK